MVKNGEILSKYLKYVVDMVENGEILSKYLKYVVDMVKKWWNFI